MGHPGTVAMGQNAEQFNLEPIAGRLDDPYPDHRYGDSGPALSFDELNLQSESYRLKEGPQGGMGAAAAQDTATVAAALPH